MVSRMHSNVIRSLLSIGSLAWMLGPCACGPDSGNARFLARESIQQIHITHADPGAELGIYDLQGGLVTSAVADTQGSLIFRNVEPGSGYVVRTMNATPQESSAKLTVRSATNSTPANDFYAQQKLSAGFGYIKTRDGTTLSVYVTLPGPIESGPYPTVIDYSGYAPSQPGKTLDGVPMELCTDFPTLCNAPNDPAGMLSSLFGYATVSVNMRGTGCSGGAYDYFETLQQLDGYDVIETVAAQDWVSFHKVGMVGISYPGISQLFVAATRPPSLAAITPLSVIGSTETTLRPGGILNNGFAISWANRVLGQASPYGQGWEQARVDGGDTICAENQLLHSQKVDNVAQAKSTEFYDPKMADPLSPAYFAPRITVPVFLAGAWQDEQTGPYFTMLLERFTNAPLTRFTVYNGVHEDGFAPQVIGEWKAFLDFFVARRIPSVDPNLRSFAPALFQSIFHAPLALPPDRFGAYTNYDEALAAYRTEPSLRVIFENGGGKDAGAPQGRFEATFARWLPKETQTLRYYFQNSGKLNTALPADMAAASSFKLDFDAGQRVTLMDSKNAGDKLPSYNYPALSSGLAVAFVSEPLAQDMVLLGTGSADLWIQSSADDADLQVTLTEVRPDGQEMYVQAGWLRASHRALSTDSRELWPVQTHLKADAAPLPAGEWTLVRVPIPGFGHIFRAGSSIRVSIDTPGGTRPLWQFDLKALSGEVTHLVSHSATYPSSVALPLLTPGTLTVPTLLPACPSLRGQPCRAYVPLTNSPAPTAGK